MTNQRALMFSSCSWCFRSQSSIKRQLVCHSSAYPGLSVNETTLQLLSILFLTCLWPLIRMSSKEYCALPSTYTLKQSEAAPRAVQWYVDLYHACYAPPVVGTSYTPLASDPTPTVIIARFLMLQAMTGTRQGQRRTTTIVVRADPLTCWSCCCC